MSAARPRPGQQQRRPNHPPPVAAPPTAWPLLAFGDPTLVPASRHVPCTVLDNTNNNNNNTVTQTEAYLMRNDPNALQAYFKFPLANVLQLQDRGKLIDCQVLKRNSPNDPHFTLTDEYVKVKKLRKVVLQRMRQNGHPENALNEIYVLQQYGDGVHVAECVEALEDANYLYLVMHDYRGGSLHDCVPPNGGLAATNYDLRPLTAKLAQNLHVVHAPDQLVHRDLSPENALLEGTTCVYTDFAMALRVTFVENHPQYIVPQNPCGKLPYMSPEIWTRQPFGQPADVWCLGGTLFYALTGLHLYIQPLDECFRHFLIQGGLTNDNVNRRFEDTIVPPLDYNNLLIVQRIQALQQIHPSVRHLLSLMMRLDPQQRIRPQDVEQHEWFRQGGQGQSQQEQQQGQPQEG